MFSQNTPPQHIGLNITKIGTASASPASGWNGCSYGMFRSVNGFWTEAIPIASDIKTSHLCCLSLALVFDTTSPSAGACAIGISSIGRPSEPRLASPRHGTLTPGRISVGRPPCLIPIPVGAGTGRKYHCPCLALAPPPVAIRHLLLRNRYRPDGLHGVQSKARPNRNVPEE